jgi:hypothetical protein
MRSKRSSLALDKANTRLASLRGIDVNLDLGNGLSVTEYEKHIAETKKRLDLYNTKLSSLDGDLNQLEQYEVQLNDFSDRMLAGVGVKFTRDSNEYEEAGGVRKSDRKRTKNGAANGNGTAKAQ